MSERPSPTIDVATLYPDLRARLERIVRGNIRAPDAAVEDACQVAWSRLLRYGDRVPREAALGWLTTTATREALRTLARSRREVSLDDPIELERIKAAPAPTPTPDELATWHEQLATVHALSSRQQRMVWLHAIGFSYSEIASSVGDSPRTVERQLLRAKRRLNKAAAA